MSRKDVMHNSLDESDTNKFDRTPEPIRQRFLGRKSRRINKNLSAQKTRATKRAAKG